MGIPVASACVCFRARPSLERQQADAGARYLVLCQNLGPSVSGAASCFLFILYRHLIVLVPEAAKMTKLSDRHGAG